MSTIEDIKEKVVPKIKWYLRYRTQLWATIFFVIGIVGGNADRIHNTIPTLKYDTAELEQKLQQIDEISEQILKIQETIENLKN